MTQPRGRRSARPSGDARQHAILATAERLLGTRPFNEISIDDLARGAGISRPTFYFYFASKDAVLLALLDRVVAEVGRATVGVLDDLADDPRARWRAAITRCYDTFRAHRAVMLAGAEVRTTNKEVRELWDSVLDGWVRHTEAAVRAERARGAAPDGVPARELAVVLNAMNERVIYAIMSGDGPTVPADSAVDVLLDVWLAAIYREPGVPTGPLSGRPH